MKNKQRGEVCIDAGANLVESSTPPELPSRNNEEHDDDELQDF